MEREKHSISLLFYVVGIVGNVTSCIVWSGHVRQMGGARFLLALSVSDSITIVSLATYSVLELLHKYCSAYIFVYLGDSFYCLSSYITIAVVAQRYISIAFPFSVSRLCSNVRTRVTLILLVATAALQNVGYAKFTTTRYLFCVDTNRTQEEVAAMQADEVDMVYVYFALNFLPLLPLVLFNSLLLRALWKMKQVNSLSRLFFNLYWHD
ncbi:hypothetical protein BaRGS_00018247 [Batillaria attramentaria]|uniref:G-protein coupled receptors family 1 profile domain-containing protein n=1 Tax=Batillaria attramentaria TaxID=370345 RepID=A0ABD0KTV9_9CAEN